MIGDIDRVGGRGGINPKTGAYPLTEPLVAWLEDGYEEDIVEEESTLTRDLIEN
jgi:hypothetical protein